MLLANILLGSASAGPQTGEAYWTAEAKRCSPQVAPWHSGAPSTICGCETLPDCLLSFRLESDHTDGTCFFVLIPRHVRMRIM